MFYIKIYRQRNFDGDDNRNSYLDKQVYFEADDLDHLTRNGTDYQTNLEYKNFAINYLNQSFVNGYWVRFNVLNKTKKKKYWIILQL